MSVRKGVAIFICMYFCTLSYSSCSSAANETPKNPEDITISVGIWPAGNDRAANELWEDYTRILKERHPQITLEPRPLAYSFETFAAMVASGRLPTVFQTHFSEPQRLIANKFVTDITDIADKYGYLSGQRSDMLDLARADGRVYGLARDAYALGLYLNMKLFREAGLIDSEGLPLYPKTFDELLNTAKVIREKTEKSGFFMPTRDGVGGWHFTNIAWAFGAELQRYDHDKKKWLSGLDSPETAAALSFVQKLKWECGVLSDEVFLGWSDWIKSFASGDTAMVFAAPDAMRNLAGYGMDKNDIAAVPVPQGPGGRFALMGGTMYMFAANSSPEQLDACFKLFEVIGFTPHGRGMAESIERELEVQKAQGQPIGPRTINVWTDTERINTEQQIYDRYTNVDMRFFREYYANQPGMLKLEYSQFCQDMYRVLDGCIREVLQSEKAEPELILRQASREFQKYLDYAY